LANTSKSKGRPRSQLVELNIIESAVLLVSELGYQKTSIEKVAAHASVGKASIYRRWKTKSAMMIAVYRWLVPEDKLVSSSSHFDKRFNYLLKKLFDTYRNSPAGLILVGLITDSQSDLETMKEVKQGIIKQRKKILIKAIKQGISEGCIKSSAKVDEAFDLVVAMIWHRLLTDRSKLNTAFAKRITRVITSLT